MHSFHQDPMPIVTRGRLLPLLPRKPSLIALAGCGTWTRVLALWAIYCLPAPAWAERAEGKPMNTIGIEKDRFGVTADGVAVDRYTLRNARGMTVRLITYGATVTELLVPDRNGKLADVALGFDSLAQYETQSPYFGCTAGRVAFRINEGKFTLDGKPYRLTINAAPHHLHGGAKGLSKVVWRAEPLAEAASSVSGWDTNPKRQRGPSLAPRVGVTGAEICTQKGKSPDLGPP